MLGGGMKEAKGGKIELQGMSFDIFKSILEFIYTNKATITTENAVELLVTADRYLLPKLMAQCEAVLRRYVDSDNATTLLRLARMHNCFLLAAACEDCLEDADIAAIDAELRNPSAAAATSTLPSIKTEGAKKRTKKKKHKVVEEIAPTLESSADDASCGDTQ